jgi:hypothetical protein
MIIMGPLRFDKTFNLGDLIQVLAIVGALIGAIVNFKLLQGDVQRHDVLIQKLLQNQEELAKTTIRLSTIIERKEYPK